MEFFCEKCPVEKKVNEALQQALQKFSFFSETSDRFKILLFVVCKIRSQDLERQFVQMRLHHDLELGELFLRIRCLNSECGAEGVIDSQGYCYGSFGAYTFDEGFYAVKVRTELFATKYFAVDKLYEIFKEQRDQAVRQMDV